MRARGARAGGEREGVGRDASRDDARRRGVSRVRSAERGAKFRVCERARDVLVTSGARPSERRVRRRGRRGLSGRRGFIPSRRLRRARERIRARRRRRVTAARRRRREFEWARTKAADDLHRKRTPESRRRRVGALPKPTRLARRSRRLRKIRRARGGGARDGQRRFRHPALGRAN